jgi:predicted dinucleotide-binding enzyme
MRILIVGAGNVGGALGRAWLKRGHDVIYAVPDPQSPKYKSLPADRVKRLAGRDGADVVVLATPFPAAKDALEALGDLGGAILIDCTNPLSMGSDGLQLTVGFETSGGEQIASWAKNAAVFKTLNQTGAENMEVADTYQTKPVMFVAGDSSAKKQAVLTLVAELGFEPIDAGPLKQARLLEPFGMLWIELALKLGQTRDFAFAMIRKSSSK